MSAVTLVLFTKTPINLLGGETAGETKKVDWLSDIHKFALITSAWTPNQETDELYSAISAVGELPTGNGYTSGGNLMGSPTIAAAGGGLNYYDLSDPTPFTAAGAGFTFRYGLAYDATTDVAWGYCDTGGDTFIDAGHTETFTINSLGLFASQVPPA